MIDTNKLNEILVRYKHDFALAHWEDEKYKWEAIQWFQEHWDIDAPDFPAMLAKAFSKTKNLLASRGFFSAKMIKEFATKAPEEIRSAFRFLFDESVDVVERINEFKVQGASWLSRYGKEYNNHYQDERAITTYLWLRYPDTYYIYKYGIAKDVAQKLGADYQIKKSAYANNIRNYLKLYNELRDELKKDQELVELLQSSLTPSCYPDPQLHTLAIDVGVYISNFKHMVEEWMYENYSPEISTEQWIELLNDPEVFNLTARKIMKRFEDFGGQATCSQLAAKYGGSSNLYNSGSVGLAQRVAKKTNCPIPIDDGESERWWPILYVGQRAKEGVEGVFIWKLRPELARALEHVDLSDVPLKEEVAEERGYWWLNASPDNWDLAQMRVGDTGSYTLLNENGNKRRIYQNFLDAKEGDPIIGYVSSPHRKIVALAEVVVEQDGTEIVFEKKEALVYPIAFETLKEAPELENMEFFRNSQGSFFKLSKGEYELILDLIREQNPKERTRQFASYTKDDFLNEVYMSSERYDELVGVLKHKKNIILQGPPGVGKTFAARRLAHSIMKEKDEDRVKLVQFHQSYSYEDFMMGYKPADGGFKLKDGVFYQFCKKAENQPDKDFFFIIDEINRGNISRIFGELLMLIEKDYRDTFTTLAYRDEEFTVPSNVYLIGLMNTADRSLAMIDYALRRRFSFIELEPGFDSSGFSEYQRGLDDEILDELLTQVKALNEQIQEDPSLGRGFCIGHSYFCNQNTSTEEWLRGIVQFEILPLLEEYWFDDPKQAGSWENKLMGVFQ